MAGTEPLAEGGYEAFQLQEVAKRATRDLCRLWLDDADLLRVVITCAAVDPRLRARGMEHNHRAAERYKGALWRHRSAIRRERPEDAVEVAFRLVFGTILHRILHGMEFESAQPIGRDTMVDELAAVVSAYLLSAGTR